MKKNNKNLTLAFILIVAIILTITIALLMVINYIFLYFNIIDINDEGMRLQINSQLGSMKEDIDIQKEGKDILIGFNPKFLIDALRVIDDEIVTLYMVNPKAPCFIKDEKESYTYLILPVNFNNAAR